MPKLTLDITLEQQDLLQAAADSHRQCIEDYILSAVLSPPATKSGQDGEDALCELSTFLQPRIAEAKQGVFSNKSFAQIKQDARAVTAS